MAFSENEFKQIREYPVGYHLSQQFRDKAVEEGCVVYKVVELKSCVLLHYILIVPEGKEDLIDDMAFMTHIYNPEFQKYYVLTEEIISEMSSRRGREEEQSKSIKTEQMDDQTVARLILQGFYPFYSNKLQRFIYFINEDGKLLGTTNDAEYRNKWCREIYYLGAGQLSPKQIDELRKYKIPL